MIILEEAKDLFVKLMQKNSKEREWEMGYVLLGYGNDSQIEGPLWENMVLATEPIKMIGFYFIINIEL
ncbi:hypothetical protein [Metabacillus sp. B2-18]|uniref:hypothetical protein n=1 Tax=Metabacillus sp. B2-18 TaxID=2897333 RepID=UPI001E4B6A41|nr:hypothetical protein [Metabacillus sp. B2-18]UGB33631.1 hypothetical protein LPC09_27235 [Metabacillus sp. B2-18]